MFHVKHSCQPESPRAREPERLFSKKNFLEKLHEHTTKNSYYKKGFQPDKAEGFREQKAAKDVSQRGEEGESLRA